MTWPETLYEIGAKTKLEGNRLDLFVNFFLIRFPDCKDQVYAEEWAERFRYNTENIAADKESTAVLFDLHLAEIMIK